MGENGSLRNCVDGAGGVNTVLLHTDGMFALDAGFPLF
jgi:hypothetical protein